MKSIRPDEEVIIDDNRYAVFFKSTSELESVSINMLSVIFFGSEGVVGIYCYYKDEDNSDIEYIIDSFRFDMDYKFDSKKNWILNLDWDLIFGAIGTALIVSFFAFKYLTFSQIYEYFFVLPPIKKGEIEMSNSLYKYLKRRDIYYLKIYYLYEESLLKGQDFGIKTLYELEGIMGKYDIVFKTIDKI